MDQLNTLAPDLDIYIIPDQPSQPSLSLLKNRRHFSAEKLSLRNIARTLAVLGICTAVGFLFLQLGINSANIIMIYILGALATAIITDGHRYSLAASLLSVLIFNFFFTYPYFSLMTTRGIWYLCCHVHCGFSGQLSDYQSQTAGEALQSR